MITGSLGGGGASDIQRFRVPKLRQLTMSRARRRCVASAFFKGDNPLKFGFVFLEGPSSLFH